MSEEDSDKEKHQLVWLHISDTHLSSCTVDDYEREKIRKALIKKIQEETKKGILFDFIFVTGDIAEKGGDYDMAPPFFNDLLKAAGLVERHGDKAKNRLFIVPGNHDTDRTKTKFLTRTLESQEDSLLFFSPGEVESRKIHFKRFHRYEEFFNDYFQGVRNFSVEQHYFSEIHEIYRGETKFNIGVIGLNSSWFSQDDDDKDKLWIGRRVVEDAYELIQERDICDVIFVLQHHPHAYLHSKEFPKIKGLITNFADIWLYGHIHEDETEEIKDQHGHILRFQSGAVYGGKEHKCRSLIGTLDLTTGKVRIKPICLVDGPPRKWSLDTQLYFNEGPHYTKEFQIHRYKEMSSLKKDDRINQNGSNGVFSPLNPVVLDNINLPLSHNWINIARELMGGKPLENIMRLLKFPNAWENLTRIQPNLLSSSSSKRGYIAYIYKTPVDQFPSESFRIDGAATEIAPGLHGIVLKFNMIPTDCEILQFSSLNPSTGFEGEKLSLNPIKSIQEVDEFFIPIGELENKLKDRSLKLHDNMVFIDVHGSGKTSLLSYLSNIALKDGFEPFWVVLPKAGFNIDLESKIESVFSIMNPEKPILVIDAAEQCPSIIENVLYIKRGKYRNLPVWISVASEELDSLKDGLKILEEDFGFQQLPLPGLLSPPDIDMFIERISHKTTKPICDFLKDWAKFKNPGLIVDAYRVILENFDAPDEILKKNISNINPISMKRYEALFTDGLNQTMREVITYVAVLNEADIELLQGMIDTRGLDNNNELIHILSSEKRRLFTKERKSSFQDEPLKMTYLHDGLRTVALDKGNFDSIKAKDIVNILGILLDHPTLSGKACLALLNLFVNFEIMGDVINKQVGEKLSRTLLDTHQDTRKYYVAAFFIEEFPELINIWKDLLKVCTEEEVWSIILDIYGWKMMKQLNMNRQALTLFKKAIEINQNDIDPYRHFLQASHNLGEYEYGGTVLDSAPKELQETSSFQKIKAYYLFQNDKVEDAVKIWKSLLEKEENDIEILINLSQYYLKNKDYQKSRLHRMKIAKLDSLNSININNIIKLDFLIKGIDKQKLINEGYNEEILKVVEHILGEIPQNKQLLKMKAYYLKECFKTEEVFKLLKELNKDFPEDIEIMINLSIELVNQNNKEAAGELLITAAKIEPNDETVIQKLISFRALEIEGSYTLDEEDRMKKELEIIEKLCNELPRSYLLLKIKGSFLVDFDRLDEAKDIWEVILKNDPNNVEILANLNTYFNKKDEFEKAKTFILKAARIEPFNDDIINRLLSNELCRLGINKPVANIKEHSKRIIRAIDSLLEDLSENHILLGIKGTSLAHMGEEEEAKKIWEAIYNEDPNNLDIVKNLGIYNIRKECFQEAKELFIKGISVDPRNKELVNFLITVQIKIHGNIEPLIQEVNQYEVLEAIEILLKDLPDNYYLSKMKISHLWKMEEYEEFYRVLSELFKKNPEDISLLILLNMYHYRREEFDEAMKYLMLAQRLDPKDPDIIAGIVETAWKKVGLTLPIKEGSDDNEDFIGVFDQLLEKLPSNNILLIIKARTLAQINRMEEAYNILLEVLKKGVSDINFYVTLGGVCFELKRYEEARTYLLVAYKKDKNDKKNLIKLIQFEIQHIIDKYGLKSSKIEKHHHLEAINNLIKKNPNDNQLLKVKSEVFVSMGKIEEAHEIWMELQKEDPYDVQILINLSYYLSNKKEYKKAKDLLLTAIATDPKNNELINRLIMVELRMKGIVDFSEDIPEHVDALAIVKDKLLNEIPENYYLRIIKAKRLLYENNFEKAKTILNDLHNEDPSDVEVRISLAEIFSNMSDFDKAKSILLQIWLLNQNRDKVLNLLIINEFRRNKYDLSKIDKREKDLIMLDVINNLSEDIVDNFILKKVKVKILFNLGEVDESFEIAKALIDKDPDDVELLIHICKHYFVKNDWQSSKKFLWRAAKLDPLNKTISEGLISVEIKEKEDLDFNKMKTEKKLKILSKIEKLLVEFPNNYHLMKTFSFLSTNIGRTKEIIPIWEELHSKMPEDHNIIDGLASHYWTIGESERAEELLREGIRYHPKNIRFVDMLIKVRMRMKPFEEFLENDIDFNKKLLEVLDILIEQIPFNYFLLKKKGIVLMTLKNYIEGRNILFKLLEQYPDNIELILSLSISFFNEKKYDEAKGYIIEAARKNPKDPRIIDFLIQTDINKKRGKKEPEDIHELNQEMVNTTINLQKDLPENYFLRSTQASTLRKMGKENQAYKIWLELINEEPKDIEVLFYLGSYEMEQNQLDEAKKHLMIAYKLNPKDENILNLLIRMTLLKDGDIKQIEDGNEKLESILKAIGSLIKEVSEDYYLIKAKTLILVKLSREKEALEIWEELIIKKPNDPEIIYNIGAYYNIHKNYNKARSYFHTLLSIDPSNKEAINMAIMIEMKINNVSIDGKDKKEQAKVILQIIDTLIEKFPNNTDLMKFYAHNLLNLEEDQRFLKIVEDLLEKNPRDLDLLIMVCQYYIRKEDFNVAKKYAMHVIQLDSEELSYYLTLIGIQMEIEGIKIKMPNSREAVARTIDVIDSLLKDLPYDYTLLKIRANHLVKLGRHSDACEIMEYLLIENPSDIFVLRNFSVALLRRERYFEAHSILEKYSKYHEQLDEEMIGLRLIAIIRSYEKVESLSKVEPLLKFINRDNQEPRSLYNVACAYALLKRKRDMLWALQITKNYGQTELERIALEDNDFKEYWADKDFLDLIKS